MTGPSAGAPQGSRGEHETRALRLEGIVASAMDAIISLGPDQRVILFNPAAERMFGLPAAEALGLPIEQFIPQRFRPGHGALIEGFVRSGAADRRMGALAEVIGLRTDGTEFPLEASISHGEAGGEILATVILRDVSERKRAEADLLDSRRRMQAVVEASMDALITIDARDRIMLFNPAAETIFGVSAAEAIGGALDRFIPAPLRDQHREDVRRFRDQGVSRRAAGVPMAVQGLRADGETFPAEAAISRVGAGAEAIAIVILRDVSAREAGDEARGILAREVDHRAKNTLAVVQALVALTHAPTQEAFVAAVRGRIAALGRAHTMLSNNGWRGGSLEQIVRDETAAAAPQRPVGMRGPAVLLSPNAVQPITLLMHELTTNAARHGALGADEGRVDVDWRIAPDGTLAIAWIERGGPAPAEPAAQGVGSTLIAQMTRRQLGGSLEVDWREEGARVILRLPPTTYRPPIGRPAEGAGPGAAASGPLGRVLIVEDEVLLAMELSRSLTALGWQVVGPAQSVATALRLIDNEAPMDVAVLDVNLGGELAYPVAQRLQTLGVPFVFCTGYRQLHSADAFAHSAVIHKPVNIDLLDTELRRAQGAW